MYGKVTRYFQDRGYGFILGEDRRTYFVHRSNLDGEHIGKGYYVYFSPFQNDYAKPDNSTLELMAKMEDDRIERQKQMEEDKRLDALRRQERIDAEKRKADEHDAEVRGYAESIIGRKQARMRAAEMEEAEKSKADERRQGIYDQIDGLMRISPEAADAYIQAMKKAGVI